VRLIIARHVFIILAVALLICKEHVEFHLRYVHLKGIPKMDGWRPKKKKTRRRDEGVTGSPSSFGTLYAESSGA